VTEAIVCAGQQADGYRRRIAHGLEQAVDVYQIGMIAVEDIAGKENRMELSPRLAHEFNKRVPHLLAQLGPKVAEAAKRPAEMNIRSMQHADHVSLSLLPASSSDRLRIGRTTTRGRRTLVAPTNGIVITP
jgi:hypothetical protein